MTMKRRRRRCTSFAGREHALHQTAVAAILNGRDGGWYNVQFQIPAKKYSAGWPVIMVHGSTHTGACLESTPDGREGWYPYFVRF